jgi:hypothetical protein
VSAFRVRPPWRERWQPHELGHSLPLAPRLRRWALGLAAVAAAVLALLAWALWDLGRAGTAAAEASIVRRAALDRLARVELPVWDPGGELPAVEPPSYASPPPPPAGREPHPADPPPRQPAALAEAAAAVRGDEALGAATRLHEMAREQPASWLLAYDSGIAYLATGFHDRAGGALQRAIERLESYASRSAGDPEHHAAVIASRYAAGHALRRDDCTGAIWQLKRSVAELSRYVDAGGAATFDRRLPYRVAPHPLSNLDVFGALVESYLECEGRYPDEYFAEYGEAVSFRRSEYADPDAADVREGPFREELAACIGSEGAAARCWAVSNLNSLWLANRELLRREALPAAWEPFRPALARLAFNVALLAATGPDAERAPEALLVAQRLARGGGGGDGGELEAKARTLAQHLGAATKNYAALAEGWRGRSLEQMDFGPDTPPEELKGMAWALRERWSRHLAQRRPEAMFAEARQARAVLPEAYLDSLDRWRAASREALRDALAAEIRLQKRRGDLALAAGLRDFEAGWLGEDWPDRADAAWWTPGLRAAQVGLAAAALVVLAALALLYRGVVYPYVMYTTDYYRSELARRRRERGAKDLPVTGAELYEAEQRRRGEI